VTTGGAIMGSNPPNSVINRYSQSWDVSNLFVYRASAFPQNIGDNPTGLLAGLVYFSADKTPKRLSEIPRTVGHLMKRKSLLLWVGCAVTALVAAMGISFIGDELGGENARSAPVRSADLIARGAYLAKLGDCAACHSIPARPPFSGGLRMGTPIGAIYSTDITPDASYGIGRFTLADFDESSALRRR
jgi:hypothetical protein